MHSTTTSILEGATDWEPILRKDLELSDDDSPKLANFQEHHY